MRKHTTQSFVDKAIAVHGNSLDYSLVEYVNNVTNVLIVCPIHGMFTQVPNNHLRSKCGCPTCGRSTAPQQFVARAIVTHGNRYDYSLTKYTNRRTQVTIICKIHGTFMQLPTDHLQGSGCTACAYKHNAGKRVNTTLHFIKSAKEVHGELYDYSHAEYAGTHTKIKIICKIHGEFLQTPNNHISNAAGCKACSHIVSEKEQQWLSSLGLPNNVEHRQIKTTIKNQRVWFDGFDPTTNTVYEFWGDFWHGHPTRYNPTDINCATHTTFGELYANTMKKRQQILDAGYNLVEIWESDYDRGLNPSVHK